MTGKLFSLHKRIKKNKSIYYCQFKLPDDSWSTAKSTGETTKVKAENWAIDYLRAGKIIKSENTTLEDFAVDFFSWDGEWATDKRATGKRISERQCKNKQRHAHGVAVGHVQPRIVGQLLDAQGELLEIGRASCRERV